MTSRSMARSSPVFGPRLECRRAPCGRCLAVTKAIRFADQVHARPQAHQDWLGPSADQPEPPRHICRRTVQVTPPSGLQPYSSVTIRDGKSHSRKKPHTVRLFMGQVLLYSCILLYFKYCFIHGPNMQRVTMGHTLRLKLRGMKLGGGEDV